MSQSPENDVFGILAAPQGLSPGEALYRIPGHKGLLTASEIALFESGMQFLHGPVIPQVATSEPGFSEGAHDARYRGYEPTTVYPEADETWQDEVSSESDLFDTLPGQGNQELGGPQVPRSKRDDAKFERKIAKMAERRGRRRRTIMKLGFYTVGVSLSVGLAVGVGYPAVTKDENFEDFPKVLNLYWPNGDLISESESEGK